ncbi:hypothetical protein [Nocardia sp. N2S4-5]|uniref:hypothetical protein n=1 Tax=Nocardia sp. N2S4-5 TaxID=3351565 RepID=UPI0037D3203B
MPGRLDGHARFTRTTATAQRGMRSTEPSKRAARIAARAARAAAPRASGRLRRSIRADGPTVVTHSVYAAVQNFGWPARNIRAQPFFYDHMRAVEPLWLNEFERNRDIALGRVRGV